MKTTICHALSYFIPISDSARMRSYYYLFGIDTSCITCLNNALLKDKIGEIEGTGLGGEGIVSRISVESGQQKVVVRYAGSSVPGKEAGNRGIRRVRR
jgi:hypothetical protein